MKLPFSKPELLLFSFFLLFVFAKSYSQTCEQVEILYTEPDCFKHRGQEPGGSGDPKACKQISVCEDQPYQYLSSITGPSYTYLWSVTGPSAVTFNPNNTSDFVNIVWPTQGAYTLTLTLSDNSGVISTYCLTVNVKEKPIANFTFSPNNVCAGSTVCFTNSSTISNGGMVYNWNFGDGNYSSAQDPCHVFTTAGTYNVTLIVSSFENVIVPGGGTQGQEQLTLKTCCSDTLTKKVTIVPGELKIECVSTVCPGNTVTYTAVGCTNTNWINVVGGTVMSSSGNQITIQWGNGAVQGQIVAQCNGGCITSIPVPIIPLNPVPVGNLAPCLNDITSYNLPVLPGTFYTWTLTNLTTSTVITPGSPINPNWYTKPDNNTININWGNISPNGTDDFMLTINLVNRHICCGSTGSIIIKPRDRFVAVSNQTLCTGGTASLSVYNSTFIPLTSINYDWTVTPSVGVSPATFTGQNFTPTFNNSGTYIVSVIETTNANCNSNVPQYLTITVLPPTPAASAITGPNLICIGATYVYTMATPAPVGYHYNWTIPITDGSFQPGSSSQTYGNSANIQWALITGTVTVTLERDNGIPCPSAPVTFTPTGTAPISSVTGPNSVCVDSKAFYSTSDGLPATWSITPASQGTILSGQGTNTVEILWHGGIGGGPWTATSVNITTACGSNSSFGPVTIYPKFTFTLSQTGDICDVGPPAGAQLSASTVTNSPTYLWSNGATTNPAYTTTAGLNTLTVTNAGGCKFTEKILVEDPFGLATLCSVGSCNGAVMQHILVVNVVKPGSTTIANPFTYQWYSGIPGSGTPIGGPIVNTTTSQSITVNNGGNYYVEVNWKGCTKIITWNIPLICCPDLNNPQITNVTQNTCFQFTFTGTKNPLSTANFFWDFGDGSPAVPNSLSGIVSHTYANAGIYCVKFCAGPPSLNPTNCTGNCTLTSVVVPIKAAIVPEVGCNGNLYINNFSVNYAPGLVTHTWNFGDLTPPVSTGTSGVPPAHTYAMAGTYNVTITMTYNNGTIICTSVDTQPVTYNPLAITVTSLPVCTGIPVTFSNNQNNNITYSWAFGDGTFAFTQSSVHIYNPQAVPPIPGPITVNLSVTDKFGNTCPASFSGNILSGSPCTLAPAYLCPDPGSTATLNAPAGTAYAWEELVGINWVPATGPNTGATYTTSVVGTFRVKVTNANGCICTTNSVQVLLVTKPTAKIGINPGKKLCAPGELVYLTSLAHVGSDISQWYLGSIAPGNEMVSFGSPSPAISGFIASTSTIFLVVTNQYGCTATCSITVEVNPLPIVPTISTLPLSPLCEGQSIVLTATPGGNILWNTGETTNSITVNAAGQYTATNIYPITGCKSSNTVVVNKRPIADLFPHFCDLLTCECHGPNNPFALYAPRPLVPAPFTPLNIQWFSGTPPSGTPIFTGLNYSLTSSGTYYIVMTDPTTGCSTTSETYKVEKEVCVDCDCKLGDFGPINATTPGLRVSGVTPLVCGKNYSFACNVPITFSGNFICAVMDCPSKVTYTLTQPFGPNLTGTLPFVYTPTATGNYTLTLNGYCDGVMCKECIITFDVSCGPLKIDLFKFEGRQNGKVIDLEWITASETNNDYFILEKSDDGNKFNVLGNVKSTSGNVIEKIAYNFQDIKPIFGTNYYRLKAVDISGKITDSKIIAVDYSDNSLAKIYPNPSKDSRVNFEITLGTESKVSLEWYDVLGRSLQTNKFSGTKGQNKWTVDVSNLPTAKYLVRVLTENGASSEISNLSFEKMK